MKTHAADCGIQLSQEICLYLLRHGQRDLPSLMMTLEALDRYSLVHQRPTILYYENYYRWFHEFSII